MATIKKLAGQTAVYGIPTILGRALNFLMVPLYTDVLPLAEYGVLSEMYAYMAFLQVVFTYGMETAFFRFSNKLNDSKLVLDHALSSIIISTLLLAGLLIGFSDIIADILNYPDRSYLIRWIALIVGMDALVAIPFAWLRNQNKAGRFASAKLSQILINVGLNTFFLYFCIKVLQEDYFSFFKPYITPWYNTAYGVEYIFIANIAANLIYIPFVLPVFRYLRFNISKARIKYMLKYAAPVLFTGLAGMTNEMLDTILLKYWLPKGFYQSLTNIEAVGVYRACYKLSIFMTLLIQAFRYAGEPFFFAKAQNQDGPGVFANIMKWFVIICLLIFMLVSLNLDFFGLLLRKESYRQGLYIVPILLIANMFLGIFYNLSIWYKHTDKTQWGLYISGAGAFITVIFNVLLIPYLGYLGSAIATFLCYFWMAGMSFLAGKKYYYVPYPVKKLLLYILWIGIGMVICKMVIPDFDNLFLQFFVNSISGILFFVPIYLMEKKAIKSLLQ